MSASPLQTLDPLPISDGDTSDQPESAPQPAAAEPTRKRKPDEGEQQQHPLWKTSLCSYFRSSKGSCSHGEQCRYAHDESELRPRPDDTWDPTSDRAKKVAKEAPEDANGDNAAKEGDEGDDVMMTEAFAEEGDGSLSKCLLHLPMKWTSDHLKSFLNEKGVEYMSAKKKKGMVVGFVSFENAEQVKTAAKELNGKPVGNKTLKVADVVARAFEKNIKLAASVPSKSEEELRIIADDDDQLDGAGSSVLKGRSVRDVVTSLAHMPYVDQLEQKKSSLMQTLKRLTQNARKACPSGVSLPEWILKSREIGGLPCILEGIIESPLVNGYRNKCEFSVGYSVQGIPTVGFLLGNFREGVTAIEEPTDCPNVSRVACRYAAVFQEFLQNSAFPIWNRLNNSGFWRQLTVREGRDPRRSADLEKPVVHISEVLLMVQVCTTGFNHELVNQEFQRMARAFALGAFAESPTLPLTALIVQDHTGISNVAPADAPLRSIPIPKNETDSAQAAVNDMTEERINDYVNGLRFCISPTAFFQVNTLAAEKLYSLAGEWAGLGPDTLLFDICCGTGTIGLTLAHRVGMVVGIEMNASAVSDAQRNAEINGIKNCKFVCAKAEDVMGSLLKEYVTSPQEHDGILETSEENIKKLTAPSEKANPEDIGPEHGESSSPEDFDPEHEKSLAPGCAKKGSEEREDQLEKSCTVGSTAMPAHHFKNVVAIVDPPRVGLHPTVIKVLRTHPRLKRLVYISCNPESLVANAIELCTPSADKSDKGNNKNNRHWRNMSSAGLARRRAKSMPYSEPFKPVKAMAVDLFPHTPHCELVMLLER